MSVQHKEDYIVKTLVEYIEREGFLDSIKDIESKEMYLDVIKLFVFMENNKHWLKLYNNIQSLCEKVKEIEKDATKLEIKRNTFLSALDEYLTKRS